MRFVRYSRIRSHHTIYSVSCAFALLVSFSVDGTASDMQGQTKARFGEMIGAPPKSAAERTTPRPRDPKLAVKEEFEMARREGTREAFELFIARHPESPLAAEARRLLERLHPRRR